MVFLFGWSKHRYPGPFGRFWWKLLLLHTKLLGTQDGGILRVPWRGEEPTHMPGCRGAFGPGVFFLIVAQKRGAVLIENAGAFWMQQLQPLALEISWNRSVRSSENIGNSRICLVTAPKSFRSYRSYSIHSFITEILITSVTIVVTHLLAPKLSHQKFKIPKLKDSDLRRLCCNCTFQIFRILFFLTPPLLFWYVVETFFLLQVTPSFFGASSGKFRKLSNVGWKLPKTVPLTCSHLHWRTHATIRCFRRKASRILCGSKNFQNSPVIAPKDFIKSSMEVVASGCEWLQGLSGRTWPQAVVLGWLSFSEYLSVPVLWGSNAAGHTSGWLEAQLLWEVSCFVMFLFSLPFSPVTDLFA